MPTELPRCGNPACRWPGCVAYDRADAADAADAYAYAADAYAYAAELRIGYDRDGYDRDGYNRYGYDRDGYDRDGYRDGYNRDGYDRYGYDRDGYDRDGYDSDGYNSDGYDSDGYNSDGYDRDGMSRHYNGDCAYDCAACNAPNDERLNSYTYRPRPRFNGDSAPYYGMELEVTTDNVSGALDVVESMAPRLAYCKEDSSVDGLEIVTHPMSYDWAMKHFPWRMLSELNTVGAQSIAEDNGIHIHVGRDGFDGSAHMFRWLKFWYRNPRDIQRIARRRANHWGPFSEGHRAAQKHAVKRGKPGYDYLADRTSRDRYAAINTTNDATLEVRVFASTLRPQRAQAALQLVAGSVEYTRQLTAEAVTHRHGWDWQAFTAWAGKSGAYPALMAENRIRRYL